ncbi:hypothetical protein BS17DRAFT_763578 [Gyrodon lividus]|nr:hypothetical protein BS17DRAFT_763578 [Gyrodon lividus]
MEPTSGEVDHGDTKQSPVPDVDIEDKGEEYEGDDFNNHHQWEQTSFDGTSCGKCAAGYQVGDDIEMGSVYPISTSRGQNISLSPTPPPSHKSGKLHTPWSNSSETNLTRGASGSAYMARHVKSEVLGCILGLNNETESMIASLALEKTAQYQAKIDHTMQDRELNFRWETCDIEHADAEVAHIRNQEVKKLNIELLEKEAETLFLKIQLAGLTCTNDLLA